MTMKILCVDDDPNILSAFQRHLRRQFILETTEKPEEALALIQAKGPYAIIVSDYRMPGMDGIQLLTEVRRLAPETVRFMLTGYADVNTAMEAVNQGNIFRLLSKPCSAETLTTALQAGLEQYRLVTSEKDLLNKTFLGSVKILTDVLSLVSPSAFGRGARVLALVRRLCAALGVERSWQIEAAANLSQIGCVAIPPQLIERVYNGELVTSEEKAMFDSHPMVGQDLIANIPRLEAVAEIISYQEKHYNGTGVPEDACAGEAIPLGARILHVALDYDTLLNRGKTPGQAFKTLQQHHGFYDPWVLDGLSTVVQSERDGAPLSVALQELQAGMVLADEVRSVSGVLLIAKGQEISFSLIARLRNFALYMKIKEPIRVVNPED